MQFQKEVWARYAMTIAISVLSSYFPGILFPVQKRSATGVWAVWQCAIMHHMILCCAGQMLPGMVFPFRFSAWFIMIACWFPG